jgi:hypothetical protein
LSSKKIDILQKNNDILPKLENGVLATLGAGLLSIFVPRACGAPYKAHAHTPECRFFVE